MARVPVTVYKNSVLATILSGLGTALWIAGLAELLLTEFKMAALLVIIGIWLLFQAEHISARKKMEEWKKIIEQNELQNLIRTSIPDTIAIYNTNPCEEALKYIESLNEEAAMVIRIKLAEEKKKKNNNIK